MRRSERIFLIAGVAALFMITFVYRIPERKGQHGGREEASQGGVAGKHRPAPPPVGRRSSSLGDRPAVAAPPSRPALPANLFPQSGQVVLPANPHPPPPRTTTLRATAAPTTPPPPPPPACVVGEVDRDFAGAQRQVRRSVALPAAALYDVSLVVAPSSLPGSCTAVLRFDGLDRIEFVRRTTSGVVGRVAASTGRHVIDVELLECGAGSASPVSDADAKRALADVVGVSVCGPHHPLVGAPKDLLEGTDNECTQASDLPMNDIMSHADDSTSPPLCEAEGRPWSKVVEPEGAAVGKARVVAARGGACPAKDIKVKVVDTSSSAHPSTLREVPFNSLHGTALLDREESLIVECAQDTKTSAKAGFPDIHVRNIPRPELLGKPLGPGGGEDGERPRGGGVRVERIKQGHITVVVLFVDSLSRALFHSRFPKTLALLREYRRRRAADAADAVPGVFDFRNFRSVQTGTHNNLPPLFCGRPYEKCPKTGERWLFSRFKRAGYVTSFAGEECTNDHSSFIRLHMAGKPTTFASSLSWKEWAKVWTAAETLSDHSLYHIFCASQWYKELGTKWSADGILRLCFGGQFLHKWGLHYSRQFLANYGKFGPGSAGGAPAAGLYGAKATERIEQQGTPPQQQQQQQSQPPPSPKRERRRRFSYTSLAYAGHEGSTSRFYTLDADLEDQVRWIFEHDPDDQIFAIINGDHGIGFGPYHDKSDHAKTHYLRPNFVVLTSAALNTAYPAIERGLTANLGRLITAYDIYQTLSHLTMYPLEAPPPKDDTGMPEKGASLLNPLPPMDKAGTVRSCTTMGLSQKSKFCSCPKPAGSHRHKVDVPRGQMDGVAMAMLVARHVNEELRAMGSACSKQSERGTQKAGSVFEGIRTVSFSVPEADVVSGGDPIPVFVAVELARVDKQGNVGTPFVVEALVHLLPLRRRRSLMVKHLLDISVGMAWDDDKGFFQAFPYVLEVGQRMRTLEQFKEEGKEAEDWRVAFWEAPRGGGGGKQRRGAQQHGVGSPAYLDALEVSKAIDGGERQTPWEDWTISVTKDAGHYWNSWILGAKAAMRPGLHIVKIDSIGSPKKDVKKEEGGAKETKEAKEGGVALFVVLNSRDNGEVTSAALDGFASLYHVQRLRRNGRGVMDEYVPTEEESTDVIADLCAEDGAGEIDLKSWD